MQGLLPAQIVLWMHADQLRPVVEMLLKLGRCEGDDLLVP